MFRVSKMLLASVVVFSMAVVSSSEASNFVTNGHFDANAADFAEWPGYFQDRNPSNPAAAPGWFGGSGINGTATGLASSPFAPATNVPHFLFMQGVRNLDQTITTTAASPYLFTFEAAARNGNTAGVTAYADAFASPSLVLRGDVAGSWWLSTSSFQKYAFAFTGAGSQTIRFTSSGTGDHTSNIDNVAVTLINQPITVTDGTTFFTETSGTVGFDFHLAGQSQTFFQRAGAPTYTGNITTDGSAGTFNILSFGRQAGARNLTFSGNTIALGDKTLSLLGQNFGGNVDSLGQANDQMTTLQDVTLSTNADLHVSRGALRIAGNSVVNIGGQLSPPPGPQGSFAWNNLIIQDNAQVTAAGGVDFSNVASNLAFNGGTLTTPSIWGNVHGGTQTILNGTRIVASQANPDFLRVSTSTDKAFHSSPAVIANCGAIFDTNGHDIGVLVNLVNHSGQTGTLTKLGAGTLTLGGANTYSGRTTVREGALMVNGALAGTASVSVGVETIFYDSFDGDAASGLHGTRPVIGSGAWNASTRWTADGSKSVTGNANAFLPFTPAPGNVYSLSLDVNTTAGGNDWLALGYSAGASVDGNFHPSPNNTVGWTLRRATGGFQTFLGPSTAGGDSHVGSPGWVNVEVQLDTTGDQWLFEWFVDGTSIRGPQALANPNIAHVAFGGYNNALGSVDNFTLAILDPSPALLGGTGSIAGDTTIGRFGTLAPGGSAPGERIGTLTFSDSASLILNPGATIDWDFLNNTEEGTTYDHLVGDALYLPDSEGAINLNIAGLDGYSLSAGDSFTLFSGDVHLGSTLTEYGQDLTHLFNITDNVNWWGTWEVTAGSLVLTAVPEPGTWMLLLSALACGLLFRRRK